MAGALDLEQSGAQLRQIAAGNEALRIMMAREDDIVALEQGAAARQAGVGAIAHDDDAAGCLRTEESQVVRQVEEQLSLIAESVMGIDAGDQAQRLRQGDVCRQAHGGTIRGDCRF